MKDKQTIFFFIEKIHFSIFYFIFLFVQRKENILFVTHHLLLLTLELLLGQLLLWRLVISHLSDNLFFLRKNQLDMAWAWHIRVDATVSTVCTATQAWSTVDLHERKINKHMKMISWLCKMGFARRLVMWMWHKDIRHSSYWNKCYGAEHRHSFRLVHKLPNTLNSTIHPWPFDHPQTVSYSWVQITYLNVVDDQTVNIQSLVVSVGFGVLQKLQKEICRLLWPTTLGGVELFSLAATADATVEVAEWHALLLFNDVLQVTLSTTQWHVLDGLCGLMGVLMTRN